MLIKKLEIVEPKHPDASKDTFATSEEAIAELKEAGRSKTSEKHFFEMWETTKPKKKKTTKSQLRAQMYKELADALVDGRLRKRVRQIAAGTVFSTAKQPKPKSTWAPKPYLKIRDRAAPPPPDAGPETNVAQQVAALQSAADAGAPFCERCVEQDEARADDD